jgi:hypothetical protein
MKSSGPTAANWARCSPPTASGEHLRSSLIRAGHHWSKFRSRWAMPRFRRPSGAWASCKTSPMRPAITSASGSVPTSLQALDSFDRIVAILLKWFVSNDKHFASRLRDRCFSASPAAPFVAHSVYNTVVLRAWQEITMPGCGAAC